MSYRFADSLGAGSGRNCPKHVESYSKNKFEKSVHLVGFVIRIYHDARSPERQILRKSFRSYPSVLCYCYMAFNSLYKVGWIAAMMWDVP